MGSYGYGFKNGWPLVTAGRGRRSVNAFSPVKSKLTAGQNASLLIIGDSTSYTKFGPYYLFGAWLGAQHNATVRIRRWDEWGPSGAGDGPKAYAAADVVATGTGSTLDIWLASLPGSGPYAMFDKARRPTAIDALARPDLVVWHHGHNITSYEMPVAGMNYLGRGLFLGPIGMISHKWPGVPQALTNQTPWRDNSDMNKVVDALNAVRLAKPDITIIDTHSRFLPNKSDPLYYRLGEVSPGVHPSDLEGRNIGAQSQADAISSAWMQSAAIGDFSTADWVSLTGTNLMPNGDMLWPSGGTPTGWTVSGSTAVIVKNTTEQYPGFDYCVEIQPGATPSAARLQRTFLEADVAPLRGKTVSLAILAKRTAGQRPPYMPFVTRTQSPPGRTLPAGPLTTTGLDTANPGDWNWYVVAGIPIDADAAANLMSLAFYPSFNNAGNGGSLFIQKAVLVEGALPKGLMP